MDTSLSSNLLEGVEDVLQADNITQTDDDELTVSKKVMINHNIYTLYIYTHFTHIYTYIHTLYIALCAVL